MKRLYYITCVGTIVLLVIWAFFNLSPLSMSNIDVEFNYNVFMLFFSIISFIGGVLLIQVFRNKRFVKGIYLSIVVAIFSVSSFGIYVANGALFNLESNWEVIDTIAINHLSHAKERIEKQRLDFGALGTSFRIANVRYLGMGLKWIVPLDMDNLKEIDWIELEEEKLVM
ncbi:MAG: hypothetical protein ACPG4Z_00250 [Chitinophagales bacterium]